MAVMIGLVGEQPLPNFLAVRHFHYDKVLLVYTKDTRLQYQYLKAALEKEGLEMVEGVETGAFYINQIAQTLDEELVYLGLVVDQEPQEPLVFNLTGGTKAMSLAAFQIAQLYGAEMLYVTSEIGQEVHAYHSLWSNKQLQPAGMEDIPACIELKDVFNLHLGERNWRAYGPANDVGGNFEKLLADTLRKYKKIVSEVMTGVKTLNGQVDMDLVVRFGNHYGIIEAKAGDVGRTLKGLQQLSTTVSLLSTYSRAFYVITVPANPQHEELMKALNFKTISLESYDPTTQQISPEDEKKLLTEIENAFLQPPGGAVHVYS
jgi:hypothetical protein